MKEFTDEQLELARCLVDDDLPMEHADEFAVILLGETFGCIRREDEELAVYKIRVDAARWAFKSGYEPLVEAIKDALAPEDT